MDTESFHAFVSARRRSLLQMAWLLTGDWDQADDLVQTALLKCYPAWDRIAVGNPDAYLRRSIVSAYSSWWRRRWRGELPTADLPERAVAVDEMSAADLRHLLLAALGRLSSRQRAAVVLRYFEDLSEGATAEVLGCSVGTVKSQTAKALARLRQDRVLLTEAQTEVADVARP